MSVTLQVFGTSRTSWTVIAKPEWHAWDPNPAATVGVGQDAASPATALIEPGTGYRLATDDARRDFADVLRRIQQHTSLDWGQVARTLGVSRRTVHNWLSGTRVSGVNAQRLNGLYNALTSELDGVDRPDSREYLLVPDGSGVAPLDRIRRHLAQQYARDLPVMSPLARLKRPITGDRPPRTGGLAADSPVEAFGRAMANPR